MNDRAMVDAVLVQDGSTNRIISLVGKSSGESQPNPSSYIGLFYSDNEGLTWLPGQFDQPSGDASRTTEDAYAGSLLPALLNGTIGGLFDGHFTLASAGGDLVYLWLESRKDPPYGGGLFISTDNGESWRAGDNPGGHTGYCGPGSMKYIGGDELALVFRDF